MRPYGTINPLVNPSKPRRKVVEVEREVDKFVWRTVRIDE